MALVCFVQTENVEKHKHQIRFIRLQSAFFLDKQDLPKAARYLPTERTNWHEGSSLPPSIRLCSRQAGRQAGSVGQEEKRQEDGGDEEAPCPWPAATDTITLREQHKTYCYSDRKEQIVFCASLCDRLRATHSIMRRIWVDTSHSRSIASVVEEEEEGRWIIQPASAAPLRRLVVCLLWGGERSLQQPAAPPHKAAITWQPQDGASKEPRFSRGQGIISESCSRIIALSQNDSRRCGTPSQIAAPSLLAHRMKWQPCPADSEASQPALSVPSGFARLWCYYSTARQYSAREIHFLPKAQYVWSWEWQTEMLGLLCNTLLPLSKKTLLFKSKCRTWALSKRMQHQLFCSASE